jgi:hypothetical protein
MTVEAGLAPAHLPPPIKQYWRKEKGEGRREKGERRIRRRRIM